MCGGSERHVYCTFLFTVLFCNMQALHICTCSYSSSVLSLCVTWISFSPKVTHCFFFCSHQLQPQEISPPPTANLDRSNDKVYENVTGLVKAVIEMSSKIQPAPPEEYVPMVKVTTAQLFCPELHAVALTWKHYTDYCCSILENFRRLSSNFSFNK